MKNGIIYWDVDPEIFSILGFPIRYYGLSWALGIGFAYLIIKKIYQKEKIPLSNLEQLSTYILIGAFLGARLGHCFFYEPTYYFQNPLEIILPIKKVGEAFEFIGFQGLASHGGLIGIVIAILIYARKTRTNMLWIMDRVAIGSTVTAALIRIGNLMNSEIYGKPTSGNWGFVFERDDLIPRHPTQLYEACSYLLIFGLLVLIYKRATKMTSNGLILGVFLMLFFTARFVIEIYKENQVGFEDSMTLNMGQILSIPCIILGLVLILRRKRHLVHLG
ncbi:prolipoprotein diacylglyceryl transferase [Aggregatimonas sangjinii]|uniref:Phosphatidylglycerol--prolipoprotein diacylglyceryl transferase n=1 Tax=Aggregatimonas sangjinii TaxID=2583587 RepID=A0A5B7SXI6_9FLAO|nr:prolipoprotein diacylglyceryl transferase [Aggregatimonas sangjinii]QCX01999.1 prolipoprotein diacylglyceryl transferase [Aggregatimonas sangjinii]